MVEKFKITRVYFNGRKVTLKKGVSREEVHEHCRDPETSSRTVKSARARQRTARHGPWFDCFGRM